MDIGKLVADIGSFVIGICGLAVAALSLWLTYKARTSLYRERLYSKQLEVYPEVLRDHMLLNEAMHRLFSCSVLFENVERDGQSLSKSVREANRLWLASEKLYECNLPFLSKEFAEKIQQYRTWAADAINRVDALIEGKDHEVGRDYAELYILHRDILQAARKDLGTDPLTQEALNLIGQMKLEKNQQSKAG